MRDLKELNLSNVRQSPSDIQIREVEDLLGFRLPQSYLEFLRGANGGHPEADTFETEQEQWAINNFFFLGDDTDSSENLLWNFKNLKAGLPPFFLPIGRDGFGNRFLLNIKSDSTDEVWVSVLDDPDHQLIKLCDRFEDFIGRLKLNPDYI